MNETPTATIDQLIADLREAISEYAEDTESDTKRQKWAQLFAWRRALEEIVGTDSGHGIIKDAAATLEERLLEEFAEDGTANWRSRNGVTVYIEDTLWATAKAGETDAACTALVENGFASFVHPTFNVQTLSAQAREMERNGTAWPAPVLEHLDLNHKYRIRGRRSH